MKMEWHSGFLKGMVILTLVLFLNRPGNSQNLRAMENNLKNPTIEFDESGELKILPSPTSSPHDFDFLIGDHDVHHKKLKARLANSHKWIEFKGGHQMSKLLKGMGNIENHYMCTTEGKPTEGMALRLFNPTTRLWSIYWADSETVTMDVPVVGSFEKNKGRFFAKDSFNGKEIILQFLWDVSDPQRPVWSQAFSDDRGKTWEWNWLMYFHKVKGAGLHSRSIDSVNVIELRNYILKEGAVKRFANFFDRNLVRPQQETGGIIMGEFFVKDMPDHFLWIRGFKNMTERSRFLPDFYSSPEWRQHRETANGMIVNSDNVHLMKPLTWHNDTLVNGKGIPANYFQHKNGIGVIDFYIANGKRSEFVEFFTRQYMPLLTSAGLDDLTLWISETQENDFLRLPVFQDKNLLLTISFYESEEDYRIRLSKLDEILTPDLKYRMKEIVTLRDMQIIYPIKK